MEINDNLKYLKDTEIIVPTPSPETRWISRMIVNYQQFNQVAAPNAAATPSILSLLTQDNMAIYFKNAIFSIPIKKDNLKWSTWNRQQYALTLLPRAMLTLCLSYNIVQRDMNQVEILWFIILILYINGIMLTKQVEQEVASLLEVCAPKSGKPTLWRIRNLSLHQRF